MTRLLLALTAALLLAGVVHAQVDDGCNGCTEEPVAYDNFKEWR